jgi:hypothetical protein
LQILAAAVLLAGCGSKDSDKGKTADNTSAQIIDETERRQDVHGGYTLATPQDSRGTVSRSPDLKIYPAGTVVTLTATADSGYALKEWRGTDAPTSNVIEVTINGNMRVMAVFEQLKSESDIYENYGMDDYCSEGAIEEIEEMTGSTLNILKKLKTVSLPYRDSTSYDNLPNRSADNKLTESEARQLKLRTKKICTRGGDEFTLNYKVNLSNKFHAIVISYKLGDHNLFTKLITYDKEYNVIDMLDIAFDEIAESWSSSKSTIYKNRIVVEDYNYADIPEVEISEWRVEPDGKFVKTSETKRLIEE